jgi:hypothetical protein
MIQASFEEKLPTAGNPYCRGSLSTVDILVQTSLEQVLFVLKILFTFVTKQATLMRRLIVLILPFQLVFPVKGSLEKKLAFKF